VPIFSNENHLCWDSTLQMECSTSLLKVQYTCNTMVSPVEVTKLLYRLELMTGFGRRFSGVEATEVGEDLQIEEFMMPEESRYFRNSCLLPCTSLSYLRCFTVSLNNQIWSNTYHSHYLHHMFKN